MAATNQTAESLTLNLRQTIAYLALGAVEHVRGLLTSPDEGMRTRANSVLQENGGQMNLVDEVTRWADTVEGVWERQYAATDFGGVWLYDVVEVVGGRIADALSEGEDVDADVVVALVQEVADEHIDGGED